MNEAYSIYPANVEDAEEILKIQKLAFLSEAEIHNSTDIPPLRQTIDLLIEDFKSYSFFKVFAGDRIIAAVKVKFKEGNTLWIARLVVHPDFQNKGIGSILMHFIESKYADAVKYELFTARLSIRNIQFYKKLGYHITESFTDPEHSDIQLIKMEKE